MKDTNYLFFNSKNKRYFYSGDPQICCICSKPVEELIYFVISLLKKEIIVKIYCWNCVNKRQNLPAVSETVTNAIICIPEDIPPKSIAVPLVPLIPGGRSVKETMTRSTGLSTIDAALDKSLGGEIIDHTKLAGRESWEGAAIGLEPVERLEQLDSPIKSEKEGLAYIEMLGSSAPVLPYERHEENKQLHYKEEDQKNE